MDLQVIEKAVAECTACELHHNRKRCVFARGFDLADIMIVGMVPGPEENEVGLPFVGRAGKMLDNVLNRAGLGTSDVYITNTVKCALRPGIPLKDSWISYCLPFLIAQIYLVKPRFIITLGADATNALLGFPLDTKIGALRGSVHSYSDDIRVIPTYHPSYLIRGGGEKHEHYNRVVEDFKKVLTNIN
jgi:uracil-DNA glycosylase